MTKDTNELLAVTEEDREAAWPFRPSCYKDDARTRHNWRDGVYDKLPVIQAFARHRLASRPSVEDVKQGEVEQAREIVARIAEGDSDNPLRVAAAIRIRCGLEDDDLAVRAAVEALSLRPAKMTEEVREGDVR